MTAAVAKDEVELRYARSYTLPVTSHSMLLFQAPRPGRKQCLLIYAPPGPRAIHAPDQICCIVSALPYGTASSYEHTSSALSYRAIADGATGLADGNDRLLRKAPFNERISALNRAASVCCCPDADLPPPILSLVLPLLVL
jgi:hypothetical protein